MAQMMLGYVFPIAFEIADRYLRMMQIYAFTRSVNYYFGDRTGVPHYKKRHSTHRNDFLWLSTVTAHIKRAVISLNSTCVNYDWEEVQHKCGLLATQPRSVMDAKYKFYF